MRKSLWIALALFSCLPLVVFAQQNTAPAGTTAQPAPQDPALAKRSPLQAASPAGAAKAESRISLDVLVADAAGKPVADLEPPDFTLLDNNQPRRILSFRRSDGVAGSKIDPPVEVILVLDAVNLPYQAVTLQRLEVEKFLRQNGGHLAQPVSLFIFTSDGLRVQPAPSKDGNALAAMLDQSTGTVRSRATAAGDYGLAEQFTASMKALRQIAENEARKPGRKMLLWIGPGWPWLVGRQFTQSNEGRQQHFQSIVELSRKLREARVMVYSLYSIVGLNGIAYEAYVKPVKEAHKADAPNLGLQVLAIQTGGRVLEPSNDLAGQIANCIADIGAYYTLSFAPPASTQGDEYHELRVQMSQPGMTVRTNTGYYNQP